LFILVVILFRVPELNVFASGSVFFYVAVKHIDDSMGPTLVWFSDFQMVCTIENCPHVSFMIGSLIVWPDEIR
jgi:hypothetical protein